MSLCTERMEQIPAEDYHTRVGADRKEIGIIANILPSNGMHCEKDSAFHPRAQETAHSTTCDGAFHNL